MRDCCPFVFTQDACQALAVCAGGLVGGVGGGEEGEGRRRRGGGGFACYVGPLSKKGLSGRMDTSGTKKT